MRLITSDQMKLDPNWYDHLKPGDTFHTGNPTRCGICGCESDYWEIVRWMIGTKLFLICPGNKVNRALHQKIEAKQDLWYKGVLPPSANDELKREIARLTTRLQYEAAAAERGLKEF